MIISKKKLNEKIAEALEQEHKERWMHDRMTELEGYSYKQFDALSKRVAELEEKVKLLQFAR